MKIQYIKMLDNLISNCRIYLWENFFCHFCIVLQSEISRICEWPYECFQDEDLMKFRFFAKEFLKKFEIAKIFSLASIITQKWKK